MFLSLSLSSLPLVVVVMVLLVVVDTVTGEKINLSVGVFRVLSCSVVSSATVCVCVSVDCLLASPAQRCVRLLL